MDAEQARVWLYRMQRRLAVTRGEAAALLTLTALLLAGITARHLQGRPQAVPGSDVAATAHRFQAGAARLRDARREEAGALPASAAPDTVRMNLNEATAAQLERLPRVGPVISERIARYRAEHGRFAEVAHLERVSGIGPKTMERLAPLLFVASPGEAPAEQEAERQEP